MAKRAKKKVVDAVWQDGNEDLLKSMIEKRSNSKIEICIDNNVGLSQLTSAIKSIPEEIERPVRWSMDMSMKYGLTPYDDAIRRTIPKYKIIQTKLDFECTLTDWQIKTLLPVVNAKIFIEEQTIDNFKLLMSCEHNHPVRVRRNWAVTYFLYMLYSCGFVCQNYQKVASEMKVFESRFGNILAESDLSKAFSVADKSKGYPRDKENISMLDLDIYNAVKGLKR